MGSDSAFGGKGRPTSLESRRRTELFLLHCARGETPVDAAMLARLNAKRALRIVSDRDQFDAAVQAIRACGVIDAVVVETEAAA